MMTTVLDRLLLNTLNSTDFLNGLFVCTESLTYVGVFRNSTAATGFVVR